MVSTFQIGRHMIGVGQPCFIIAEAGVNHNGSLDAARRLVDAAANAGADAVKFQTWITEKVIAPGAPLADYQRENIGKEKTQFEMAKELELGKSEFREIKTHAERRGILFLSTPDEEESADFLEQLGMPAFKIGSGEVTNLCFLRYVAAKGRPVILSTGMSDLPEVSAAVQAFRDSGNLKIALLHCVSAYPAKPSDCNLRAMANLASTFECPVGFSDHTLGNEIALAAVALGAPIIEKHLTLDKGMQGPDHAASADAAEFGALVRAIRHVESALGNGVKRKTEAESATKKVVQRSIVTSRAMSAGEHLSAQDLCLLRTGSEGLPASALDSLIGRKLRCAVAKNAVINREHFE